MHTASLKKLSILTILCLFLLSGFAFTSCSDDKDDFVTTIVKNSKLDSSDVKKVRELCESEKTNYPEDFAEDYGTDATVERCVDVETLALGIERSVGCLDKVFEKWACTTPKCDTDAGIALDKCLFDNSAAMKDDIENLELYKAKVAVDEHYDSCHSESLNNDVHSGVFYYSIIGLIILYEGCYDEMVDSYKCEAKLSCDDDADPCEKEMKKCMSSKGNM